MKILYGTTNPAKIQYMRDILKDLDIEVIGLKDTNLSLEAVEEIGNNPLENARIKAFEYHKHTNMAVFSCDTGLYIEGLESDKQPGVYVRRINGRELTDEEMITYYSNIAKNLGGKVKAQYKNAICLIVNDNETYEYDGESISSKKFILSKDIHQVRNEGFPLDSISIDIKTKKYFVELDLDNDEEHIEINEEAYINFFKNALKVNINKN